MLELDRHVQLKPIDRPLPLRTSSIVRATRTDLAMPTPPVSRAHRNLAAVSSFQKKMVSLFFLRSFTGPEGNQQIFITEWRSIAVPGGSIAAVGRSHAYTTTGIDTCTRGKRPVIWVWLRRQAGHVYYDSMNWLTSTTVSFPAIIVAG